MWRYFMDVEHSYVCCCGRKRLAQKDMVSLISLAELDKLIDMEIEE